MTKDKIILLTLVFINLASTYFAFTDPKMRDKLFEIYLVEASGLYGYLQQKPHGTTQRSKADDNDKEQ